MKNKVVLGLDEAGRGSVIGPLIIAGVEMNQEDIHLLRQLNVKDSKELSIKRIYFLYEEIKNIAENVYVKIIQPPQINYLMETKNLNEIEYTGFLEIILKSKAPKIIIDSFSSNSEKLFFSLRKDTNYEKDIIVKHHADKIYEIVSAASIVAKYHREEEMNKIKEKYSSYGDIGSGYPSDERTISFLKKYYKEHKSFPAETRIKWATLDEIKKLKQKKLF